MINLLWDLDGTLIESMPAIGASLNKTLEAYGKPTLPDAEIQTHIGPELGLILADLLQLTSENDVVEAKQEYRHHYRKLMLESPMYGGIRDQLDAFKTMGATQFVATAKYDVYAREIIQAHEAQSYFSHIYGSEENGHRGNKVELLDYFLKEESLNPANCIMIGDTKFDVLAGNHHNMTTIGVLWGYGSESDLKEAGAHYLAESPEALNRIVREATECGC